ncbi:hypothetical protein Patl1_20699 [Pistacia atlantica]|uniref:Uncharacterized protein n=1 Tax=Pistacia atlantica TaxID=434234 RepID=A0ACC1BLU1_9ROSI|nr:hypothetical protein Patl1_20699 [Pistacia atlantica]
MPMPHFADGFILRKFFYFGESRGHLHLIKVYCPCTMFNVHEMLRDYSGWFVKYHVDLREVVAAYPEMAVSNCYSAELYNYRYSILCVVREKNDEDSYMVLHVPRKAVCYNFKDKTFKELRDFSPAIVCSRTKFHNVLEF